MQPRKRDPIHGTPYRVQACQAEFPPQRAKSPTQGHPLQRHTHTVASHTHHDPCCVPCTAVIADGPRSSSNDDHKMCPSYRLPSVSIERSVAAGSVRQDRLWCMTWEECRKRRNQARVDRMRAVEPNRQIARYLGGRGNLRPHRHDYTYI